MSPIFVVISFLFSALHLISGQAGSAVDILALKTADSGEETVTMRIPWQEIVGLPKQQVVPRPEYSMSTMATLREIVEAARMKHRQMAQMSTPKPKPKTTPKPIKTTTEQLEEETEKIVEEKLQQAEATLSSVTTPVPKTTTKESEMKPSRQQMELMMRDQPPIEGETLLEQLNKVNGEAMGRPTMPFEQLQRPVLPAGGAGFLPFLPSQGGIPTEVAASILGEVSDDVLAQQQQPFLPQLVYYGQQQPMIQRPPYQQQQQFPFGNFQRFNVPTGDYQMPPPQQSPWNYPQQQPIQQQPMQQQPMQQQPMQQQPITPSERTSEEIFETKTPKMPPRKMTTEKSAATPSSTAQIPPDKLAAAGAEAIRSFFKSLSGGAATNIF